MIELIKKILKSNAVGKCIYPFLNKVYRLYSVPKRKRLMKKYCYTNLSFLMKIAKEEKIEIIPAFGTMLGFVREGDFIPNDDDIDLCVMPGISPKQLASILVEKYHFKFGHALAFNGVVREFSVFYNGLGTDFFFLTDTDGKLRSTSFVWHENENYNDVRQNNVFHIDFPKTEGYNWISIKNIQVPVPKNYDEWMYASYGKGWKVPDPSFGIEGNRPGRVDQVGYGYSVTYDELMNDNIPA